MSLKTRDGIATLQLRVDVGSNDDEAHCYHYQHRRVEGQKGSEYAQEGRD